MLTKSSADITAAANPMRTSIWTPGGEVAVRPQGTDSQRITAIQYPVWGSGPAVYYWADGGTIQYNDTRPDTPPHKRSGSITVRNALLRLRGLVDSLRVASQLDQYPGTRSRAQSFVEQFQLVIRAAMRQAAAPVTRTSVRAGGHSESAPGSDGGVHTSAAPAAHMGDKHANQRAMGREVGVQTGVPV